MSQVHCFCRLGGVISRTQHAHCAGALLFAPVLSDPGTATIPLKPQDILDPAPEPEKNLTPTYEACLYTANIPQLPKIKA